MHADVETRVVGQDEADIRLDRWFKRHYPTLGHGRLSKLLRTGQVRVDGKRAKANQRLEAGQVVRIPPIAEDQAAPAPAPAVKTGPNVDEALAEQLQAAVLYKDKDVIAINKPAGLAVQGGSGTKRHVDGALEALQFEAKERPKLVHRLDKDTSGILLLGRNYAATRHLTEAFRAKSTLKVYWALVVGELRPVAGTIDLPIAKLPGRAGEKMAVDYDEGKRSVSEYYTVERLGTKVAWVALSPITGRTHQLRIHMAEVGTPILGDGKYGGPEATVQGEGVSRKLHLHARGIRLPKRGGGMLEVIAPLEGHMARAWKYFELDLSKGDDLFDPFEERR